jgi:radical SAM protein (TIGR01212 family)
MGNNGELTKQTHRFNSYSRFLLEKFGQRVHKVSVHAGFTCPNRDGTVATGGCIYCNIDGFTPRAARARIPIREQVQQVIAYLQARFGAEKFIVYFQPYSNTYAPLRVLERLYREALDLPNIIGLAIGTRADCVDDDKLSLLQELGQDYFVTIEYGIESTSDETLRRVNRGHDYRCVVEAIEKTAGRGIPVGAHIILGFPWETEKQMLHTATEISRLPITFLKIHNLHIVRHTELARRYAESPFHVFTFEEWIPLVSSFLERLSPDIVIERLHGGAPLDLLIAPRWRKRGTEIVRAVDGELRRRSSYQGRLFRVPEPAPQE